MADVPSTLAAGASSLPDGSSPLETARRTSDDAEGGGEEDDREEGTVEGSDGKEGAVEEGGGESDLTNLQTLCVPCHTKKTAEQAQRRAKRKRDDAAAGSGDLRSWFAKKA